MAGIITENVLSRQFTVGPSASRELLYDISGTSDETEVYSLIYGVAPVVYQGLVINEVTAEPVTNTIWKGHARYQRLQTEYSFDTTGGTRHVTQSLSTIGAYAPSGMVAPDFGGAIGVTEDRIEGVDVPASSGGFQFQVTKQLDVSTVTLSYQKMLAAYSNQTMNNASFAGWDAGEVAFLGCQGSIRTDDRWTLTFKFGAIPNQTSPFDVGPITIPSKYGWDYLWVRYAPQVDGTAYALIPRPVAAYIERVLTPADYSVLSLGI